MDRYADKNQISQLVCVCHLHADEPSPARKNQVLREGPWNKVSKTPAGALPELKCPDSGKLHFGAWKNVLGQLQLSLVIMEILKKTKEMSKMKGGQVSNR